MSELGLPKGERPRCDTGFGALGPDGNVFAVVNAVSKALKKAGRKDKAQEFTDRAMNCESYDAVGELLKEYVR